MSLHVLLLLKALRFRIHATRIHAIRIHAVPNIRVDIILESLHAHAPHKLVGEVPYHGEEHRMDGQNCVLAATLGQSHQNAGCKSNKKRCEIDAHQQIHCIITGEN